MIMEIYAKHVPNLVKKHSVKRFIQFVNKCWDGLGWLNGKKDGYQCKIYPVHVQIVQ